MIKDLMQNPGRFNHRMAVAIEDAGFEIRDSIHWLYGSGFPKSLDVSKSLDKMAGAKREVVGVMPYTSARMKAGDCHVGNHGAERIVADITSPATDAARQWEGWGTALKPAHEPIVVARKPLAGTVAANVLGHGTGALNIDGCRVGSGNTERSRTSGDFGIVNDDGWRPTPGTNGSAAGRWPANIVFTHAADCGDQCVPSCPVAALDQQSGKVGAAAPASGPTYSGPSKSGSMADAFKGNGDRSPAFHNDQGGASRFFTVTEWDVPFRYIAKPSKRERNAGLDANHHPTIKPLALMRWLVRLVTPPNGTVLDPFLGSGTTAVAAIAENFQWVGCEMIADYLPIIEGRVKHAEADKAAEQPILFGAED